MYDLIDLIIAATIGCALSGLGWMTGFYLASRRKPHTFTVVLYLPEHDGDPTVHFTEHCANPDEALIKAAADKLGRTLKEAQEHVNLKPYYAFVFAGRQPVTQY